MKQTCLPLFRQDYFASRINIIRRDEDEIPPSNPILLVAPMAPVYVDTDVGRPHPNNSENQAPIILVEPMAPEDRDTEEGLGNPNSENSALNQPPTIPALPTPDI